ALEGRSRSNGEVWKMRNQYSSIEVQPKDGIHFPCGDELEASFKALPVDNLRTKAGRRRLQRFIDRLQAIHNTYARGRT
ncbi:unnamed protein product, partial [marine sediment metagenome]